MVSTRFRDSTASRVHSWNMGVVNGILKNPEFKGSEVYKACLVVKQYSEIHSNAYILDIDIDDMSRLCINGEQTDMYFTGKCELLKDATVLGVLYNQYFKSVCASNKKKLKYPVNDRIPEVGFERIFEKSYRFSEMWLDLAVQVIYHHSEIYDLLKKKRYFFWMEPYTSMIFYTDKFIASKRNS